MYQREQYVTISDRLTEPRKFIQVVMGPRQVGKTTTIIQALKRLEGKIPYLMYSADNIPATQNSWISECWAMARTQMKLENKTEFILIIDEVQKLKDWSEVVKKEWDEDTINNVNLKVVILGSSRVMIQKGLNDSLAGRFEAIKMTHWSYSEMKEAFGMSLEEYIYYGGYPGSVELIKDLYRWANYIRDSIIDSTINKDILFDVIIGKPALLRQTFELGAYYSGQIISLTKIIGSLQDAGNTTTLSGYLKVLKDSGLLANIGKFSIDRARQRASIPKFQVFNNSLRSVYSGYSFHEARKDPKVWGRFFESAIGAHLLSGALNGNYEVYYWRDGNNEVDYILKKDNRVAAIEVKSNTSSTSIGLTAFRKLYNPYNALIVGKGGMDAERFLSIKPSLLVE